MRRDAVRPRLLLLVPEYAWDDADLGNPAADIYHLLAQDTPQPVHAEGVEPGHAVRFALRHAGIETFIARVTVGLVETALITRALLEAFQPSVAALIGFGGIISDDLKLGDVAIASQVDCYLTKNARMSANDEIIFAGDVFRPSHSYVQAALNLKYANPGSYQAFQADLKASRARAEILNDPESWLRYHLRFANETDEGSEISHVHAGHFACAELVSTTKDAVDWLKKRDRKLVVIDMESGGFLAAATEFAHRHDRAMQTLVVRGAGGYADDRHDYVIKRHPEPVRRFAFEAACSFLTRLLSATQPGAPVDVGIILPLEEEYSYFAELMSTAGHIELAATYVEGRHYYAFDVDGLRCAATFLGDMGLVRMALATEDIHRAFNPKLLVVLGIAAGFAGPDGNMRICDVGLARSLYLYMHRARNLMEVGNAAGRGISYSDEPPIPTSEDLIQYLLEDMRFAATLAAWRDACATDMEAELASAVENGALDPSDASVAMRPDVRAIKLASGELLSAGQAFTQELADRGCSAADMEAGGAAIAYRRICQQESETSRPKFLVIRGISDRGDEKKKLAEALGKPNLLRRLCVRHATRLLLCALQDQGFRKLIASADGLGH